MAINFADAQQLRRAQKHDREAVLAIVSRHGGAVYWFCLGVLGAPEQAEELTIQVAQELLSGGGGYTHRKPAREQLLRRTAFHLRASVAGIESGAPIPPAEGPLAAAWRNIGRIVAVRGPAERIAFYLWATSGLKIEDAAEILGKPPETLVEILRPLLVNAGFRAAQKGDVGPLMDPGCPNHVIDHIHRVFDGAGETEGADPNVSAADRRLRQRQLMLARRQFVPLSAGLLVAALAGVMLLIWMMHEVAGP